MEFQQEISAIILKLNNNIVIHGMKYYVHELMILLYSNTATAKRMLHLDCSGHDWLDLNFLLSKFNVQVAVGKSILSCISTAQLQNIHEIFVLDDYKENNIVIKNIVYHDGCDFPLSTVLINSQNGSRTIIHSNKNLPELVIDDFKKLDLSKYSWIHFEGRNVVETIKMLNHVAKWKSNQNCLTTSVEVEKPKNEMLNLIHLADIVFIGKDFSLFHGYSSMEEALKGFSKSITSKSTLVCAWGEEGAMGLTSNGIIVKSKAFPPSKIVDTLGAGDTFVASTIYFLNAGHTLDQSIKYGCQVAGGKVGLKGYDGLEQVIGKIKK